ncbi:MAG TPA: four helix bundle protein [Candidatus Omnitrophota bacterium]|nr:four helix bundle protein [Candidatus Omnitrophota bacterium]
MKSEELIKKDITERTYNFSLRIIKIVRVLPKETSGFVLGKQLIASGTSIAANIEEAQGAFSKEDFIYKMQTAYKEALETNLWLRLIRDSQLINNIEIESLIGESVELRKILSSIVKSSKKQ